MKQTTLRLEQPHFDGIGAQFHRIISAYAISRKLNIPLAYDPITDFDNQIFEANKLSLDKWNSLIEVMVPNSLEQLMPQTMEISHRSQRLLPLLFNIAKTHRSNRSVVHVINSPHTITNKYPSFLENLSFPKIQEPTHLTSANRRALQIVLHIRRGELGLSQFKNRYLPLKYFERVLSEIIPKLEFYGIPYEVTIPVEPGQDRILNASDARVIASLSLERNNPNLIQVSKKGFKIVYENPDLKTTPFLMKAKWVESGDAWVDFLRFLHADIFVMSKSSLSYVAAILNGDREVVCPQFWHPKLRPWLGKEDLRQWNPVSFYNEIERGKMK